MALTSGMTWIPGGEFRMGSAEFYPEERPVHAVSVDGFWIDTRPVTVAEFRRFVRQTGYVTVAEQTPDPAQFPEADPDLLVPGSLVFQKKPGPVDMRDVRNWWAYVPGACWRRPEGTGSNTSSRDRHPVTQVAYADAQAYARWVDKDLPTEAEWEYAARGGLESAVFTWGDDVAPAGQQMANTWQGEFPWQNLLLDGYEGTSPVAKFPANGFGLYDMAGNVWEWTSDLFRPRHQREPAPCCAPGAVNGSARNGSARNGSARNGGARNDGARNDGARNGGASNGSAPVTSGDLPRRVIKGGSHLCAPNYCLRFRPAARQGETEDTSTGHIGFRCVLRPPC